MSEHEQSKTINEALAAPQQEAWAQVWDHYWPDLIKEVKVAGFSEADARHGLQVALLHAFGALRRMDPALRPPFERWQSNRLALALLAPEGSPVFSAFAAPPFPLQSGEDYALALGRMRLQGRIRRLWDRTPPETQALVRRAAQAQLYAQPDAPVEYPEDTLLAVRAFIQNLALLGAANPERDPALPQEAAECAADEAGAHFWSMLQNIAEQARSTTRPRGKRYERAITMAVVVAVLAGMFYMWKRNKSLDRIYAEQFRPPASLLADWQDRVLRSERDTLSGALDPRCADELARAEQDYRDGNFSQVYYALGDRYDMGEVELGEAAPCRSALLFYMGVAAIEMQRPGLAIECFAKIDDVENFGQDLYWYQAMALLQAARQNPALREKAGRALERAAANADTPERREAIERARRDLN